MPEVHELRGIRAMQEGRFVEAAEALSLAIKLSPNPARPAKQRGVLFTSQQQWAEARKDFSLMVQCAPANPDGWFLRAQAALALGDVRAAELDWPDVARFEARLKQGK